MANKDRLCTLKKDAQRLPAHETELAFNSLHAPLLGYIMQKTKKAAGAAFKWVETEEKMRVKTYETFTHFACYEKPHKLWQ